MELTFWEVDILGVDILGVDILGVDILRVDILGGTSIAKRLSVRLIIVQARQALVGP